MSDGAITQPFGSDILFSSQTGRDVSLPLICCCRAEALVVDHCENSEAQGAQPPGWQCCSISTFPGNMQMSQ